MFDLHSEPLPSPNSIENQVRKVWQVTTGMVSILLFVIVIALLIILALLVLEKILMTIGWFIPLIFLGWFIIYGFKKGWKVFDQ